MPYSMTGWGSCKTPRFNINLRGLNSKYREVYLHLPSEMFEAEPFIHKYISESISRGRVDVYVGINPAGLRKRFSINEKLFMEAYRETARQLKRAGTEEKPPVDFVLGVDGVAVTQDAESAALFSWKKIKPYVAKAVKDFLRMKKKEGVRLTKDILRNLGAVERQAAEIKALYAQFKDAFIAKAKEKIETIMGREGKKNFLNSEVVEVLDRYEITEELVRISSHLNQFKDMLEGNDAPGRKIDFLAQELYREANTIASKIPSAQVAHAVIVIKENTEKIREQAQNLE
jgi:uncharacterized protein (TIGR00255 family)